MNILVLMADNAVRAQFLPAENLRRLEELGRVTLNPYSHPYSEEELLGLLPQADAVITGWGCPKIGGALLQGGRHPGILAHTGGTVAPYVDEETYARGVRVVSANELYARSVAEGTLAYMLAGLRQIPHWNNVVKAGGWRGDSEHNRGLFGKRVGLSGFGAVARNLLPLLKAFDAEVLTCCGHLTSSDCQRLGVRETSLEEIFSTCDVVSLHNALTAQTYHLIGKKELSLLKEGAVLVNTARGSVMDEAALIEELKTGRFTAVLDVFESEPLDPKSPLLQLDNAILMPHMGGPTWDLYKVCGAAMVEEIKRFRDGEPLRYEISRQAARFMTAKG